MSLLENLRQEPQRKRRTVALAATGGIVGIIFIVWLTTLVHTISRMSSDTSVSSSTPKLAEEEQSFMESFGRFTDEFKAATAAFKENTNALLEGIGEPVEYTQEDTNNASGTVSSVASSSVENASSTKGQ